MGETIDLDRLDPEREDLGPCCVCEGPTTVCHIQMLPWRAAVPGHGWGCIVCNLPHDGAIAVVCADCVDQPLKFACRGTPSEDGRLPIHELDEPFDHDAGRHALAEGATTGTVH